MSYLIFDDPKRRVEFHDEVTLYELLHSGCRFYRDATQGEIIMEHMRRFFA
jgi:hypothetical protein